MNNRNRILKNISYIRPGEQENTQGKGNFLLLGVTGGIASGKTTVARILEKLGALIIDYDLIARQVVEPGKPAWKEIVDYFGRQILQEDDSLDRKKLSRIIFEDVEEREKLEAFTHPRIHEQFVNQLNIIAKKESNTIIQVVIPLLIEQNLQHMFHKILLVYIPEKQQIERLVMRDKISNEEARNILNAQLSIDEKVGYADFVIKNDGSLEDTREQAEKLWQKLVRIQKDMIRDKKQ